MLEFDFVKASEEYRTIFRQFPLPAVICDRVLTVYWSNTLAKTMHPALTAGNGIAQLLAEHSSATLFDTLEREGSCTITGVFALGDTSIVLLPVYSEARLIGAVVLLLVAQIPPGEQIAYRTSRMAELFGAQIRGSVNDIFTQMDSMAVKSDLLQSGWIKPGLNRIGLEGYQILRLAENVSEYAKFQSGTAELAGATVDLCELLLEARDTVAALGSSMQVPIAFAVPVVPCLILGDRPRLEVALFNLIHNSLFYTRTGNHVKVSLQQQGDEMFLSVQDFALGIPQEQLEKLWRPYATYTHGGRSTGVGLGLALVRAVALGHGGEASIRSSSGVGTTVTLRLPAVSPTSPLNFRQVDSRSRPADRFSRVYVGLCDAAKSPYRNRQDAE